MKNPKDSGASSKVADVTTTESPPPLRGTNGLTYIDANKKVEILNGQFSSIFTQKPKDLGNSPYPTMPYIAINNKRTEKLLINFKLLKAAGPDEIYVRILNENAVQLAPALSYLLQASLNQGQVPEDWKSANVSPIFKKGEPQQIS